jgi:hypothetical protein
MQKLGGVHELQRLEQLVRYVLLVDLLEDVRANNWGGVILHEGTC